MLKFGDPGRTLTCDLRGRNSALYTTELRDHINIYTVSIKSKFQLGINANQQMIWNDDFSVIDYFNSYGLYLNFYFGNIFTETNTNPQDTKDKFYNFCIINNYFFVDDLFVKVKFLADSFNQAVPKTVFCLREENSKFVITKGSKKLYAFAINNISNAYIISLTQYPTAYSIKNDSQLYSHLKSIDPTTDVYRINLGWHNDLPNIQYLENVETLYKWCNVHSSIVEQFKNFSSNKIRVAIENNVSIVDPNLEVTNKEHAQCIITNYVPGTISYKDVAFNGFDFFREQPNLEFETNEFKIQYLKFE